MRRAIATLESLKRSKRLAPDRAKLLARCASSIRSYRTVACSEAIAVLEPFVDPGLSDPHGREVAEAIATVESLKRSKRLAPDRAKLLARMR